MILVFYLGPLMSTLESNLIKIKRNQKSVHIEKIAHTHFVCMTGIPLNFYL